MFSDRLFIKGKLNESIYLNNSNKEYYNFNKCIEFIEGLEVKSKEAVSTIYYYKERIIILTKATELSFLIKGNSRNIDLDKLISPSIQLISESDKSQQIKNIIIECIRNKKNIVVLGDAKTRKEEMISAFSDYFSIRDRILNIYEDITIDLKYGSVSRLSTDIDSILKKDNIQLNSYISDIKSEKFDRIIYAKKNFRNEEKFLEELLNINDGQLIIYMDYRNDYLNEKLTSLNELSDEAVVSIDEAVISKADLVIYLKFIYAIKSDIIEYVYERIDKKLQCIIQEKIDYNKLNKIIKTIYDNGSR